jgi:large subunit ribosomal protein L15
MPRKKNVRQKGKRTHGWGSQKKHRGAGSRGGRGRAGITKHNKLKYWKRGESVGKRGFISLKQKMGKGNFLNIRDLEGLAPGKKEINLTELGYEKLLGSGEIKKPLVIKAKSFSPQAKAKIEKAGGKALTS